MRLPALGAFLLTAGGLLFFSAAFAFEGTTPRLLSVAVAALLALIGGRLYGNPWASMSAPVKETWSPRRRTAFLLTAVLTPAGAFATVISGLISDGLNPVAIVFLLATALSFAVFLLLPLGQQS